VSNTELGREERMTSEATSRRFLALLLLLASVLVPLSILVLRGGMNMPGTVVFFSLIGGIAAFGPIGLVLGPLTIAFFVALMRMYRREGAQSAGEHSTQPGSRQRMIGGVNVAKSRSAASNVSPDTASSSPRE
jgi:hypothetical protein